MLIALLGCISFSTAAFADTEAPNVSFWTTQGDNRSGSAIQIGFDAWDNVGVTSVAVFEGDTYLGQAVWDYWGCDHAWVYQWTGVVGNHSIVAKAYDAAGNVGTSVPFTLSISTVVTITSPTYGNVSGVVNNFTATTTDPVIKADLKIDGVLKTSQNYSTATTNPVVNYNWDTNQYTTSGYHNIEMICYTENGNVASSGTRQVRVGTIVTMTNPESGYVWGTLTNFYATANNPIQRADLYIDGVKRASNESVNGTNINILYNWDTTQYSDYSTHNIEIRAYTAGGTEAIGTSTVEVNNYDQWWW